jgi:hypothetical protein
VRDNIAIALSDRWSANLKSEILRLSLAARARELIIHNARIGAARHQSLVSWQRGQPCDERRDFGLTMSAGFGENCLDLSADSFS